MEIPGRLVTQQRVVIVGAGFAGLTLAKKLSPAYFQVVLIDKHNYHQFQPLLYQVATAGLEPNSISFPLRKVFQKKKNVFIRIAEVSAVYPKDKKIATSTGELDYDFLVLAHGAATNYFGMQDIAQNAFSMKSVSEALLLRNTLLQNYEQALIAGNKKEKAALLNIVIVGGGPTGVELAGAIAEMKAQILPRDYPELNFNDMNIHLIEAAPRLLNGMSERSAVVVKSYLQALRVKVHTGISVKSYDGYSVALSNNTTLYSYCMIWAAGVKGNALKGVPAGSVLPDHSIEVDEFNRLKGHQHIFALGDAARMPTKLSSRGYPQVAPVAVQQAVQLAANFKRLLLQKEMKPFRYKDKGSMAIVGRNRAVAEMAGIKLRGFVAWMAWLMVHLMSIIGVKNRLLILVNWMWQYITYDQSLRLIIRSSERKSKSTTNKISNNEKNSNDVNAHRSLVGV
ncbi:NAD(P)/FAD-dependent oxidoreductase [Agriterribacter sp.]|uniref:NAD(P)/FAD-dependent oxidoreductase n=1 Tax=Agriterribacter sp. TaxID=2821509 RepID=UPI002BAE389B|nr:NAD(P)/FAD-dependent oxidoreductase [Agriterribacter sp.]HTN08544.1 NAD(P)/FAD-dependent oxidoreductase [Agriterribacter sp.]